MKIERRFEIPMTDSSRAGGARRPLGQLALFSVSLNSTCPWKRSVPVFTVKNVYMLRGQTNSAYLPSLSIRNLGEFPICRRTKAAAATTTTTTTKPGTCAFFRSTCRSSVSAALTANFRAVCQTFKWFKLFIRHACATLVQDELVPPPLQSDWLVAVCLAALFKSDAPYYVRKFAALYW